MLNLYSNQLLRENLRVKPEFKVLEEKNFVHVIRFPMFKENEWVWYVFS